MSKKILIMGLPGSGKTTLANELAKVLVDLDYIVEWFNADDVRKKFNDWDFSREGRIRQAQRMFELSSNTNADFVICDFIAPLPEMRDVFAADYTVWLNTIDHGRYEDTNSMFVNPIAVDFEIVEKNAVKWAELILPCVIKS